MSTQYLAAKSISDFKGKYDRIISFDRRDVGSIITHQSWSRCCSNAFADELANQLNSTGLGLSYIKDDGGVYTDSAEFIDIIPECTNISVGYYKEHTHTESQDIDHLERLANACLQVDWDNLPTVRDPKVTEYKTTTTYTKYGTSYKTYGSSKKKKKNKNKVRSWEKETYGEFDDWYDEPVVNDDDLIFDEDGYSPNYVSNTPAIKSGREYFDNGSGLIDVSKTQSHYAWVMNKFSGKLTVNELAVIKTQYLDMESDNDKQFYDYLVQYINDESL
jgi:hypothetical protein